MKKIKNFKRTLVVSIIGLFMLSALNLPALGVVLQSNNSTDFSSTSGPDVNVGEIRIGDNKISVTADDKTVDLGVDGGQVVIQAKAIFKLTGWCDHGYAYLYVNDELKDSADYGGDDSFKILTAIINDLTPGDELSVKLKGRYTDCLNDNFAKSDTCKVKIKYYGPKLGVSTDHVMESQYAGSTAFGEFYVKNVGGERLKWDISFIDCEGKVIDSKDYITLDTFSGLKVNPTNSDDVGNGQGIGPGGRVKIKVEYTLPDRDPGYDVNNGYWWRLKVHSSTTGEEIEVKITMKMKPVAKSLQLFNVLEVRFPALFRLLLN
jgi:hypothetical protein